MNLDYLQARTRGWSLASSCQNRVLRWARGVGDLRMPVQMDLAPVLCTCLLNQSALKGAAQLTTRSGPPGRQALTAFPLK